MLMNCRAIDRPALVTVLWLIAGGSSGCARSHVADEPDAGLPTELELAAADAVDTAWHDAQLPTTPTACLLDALSIECPAAEWFDRACPGAWECLGWRLVFVDGERFSAPVAYMSPQLPRALIPHQAVHASTHAAFYCYGRGPWYDPFGSAHGDPAVWAGKGGSRPDSVEQRAQRLIDAVEWPVECLSPVPGEAPTEGPVGPSDELRAYVLD